MSSFTFGDLHQTLPRSTSFLIIHGELDRIVPVGAANDLRRRIPWARTLRKGANSYEGEVPSFQFGHMWWEYFDISVWKGVLEGFLDGSAEGSNVKARL